ncbi:glycosyltransferase family 4 protein [Alphaproteobacteria bacterium]|nr:glycosyltransferase family 4 protein [Alphaproteobacteria bacterium]
MKINILLPHKEKFDKYKASSVSTTVKNNLVNSKYKKNIMVFGQDVNHPILTNNFRGIKDPHLFFKSKNKNLAEKMCKIILAENDKRQIVEVHNRPYLVNIVHNFLKENPISLFYHNDPQSMLGSKTTKERADLLKKVQAIFCVSKFIKNKFLEGLDKDIEKVSVVYNGVERSLKTFPKKSKSVIFVGRLVPEKGVSLFVEAVKKLAPKFIDWKFYICGSPILGNTSSKSDFASKITKEFLKIGKQAIVTGFLSHDEVQIKMKEASLVVIPSLWDEPFGLVVAEAMSNGCAIITVNKGGIPEIIGNNGLIIEDININKLIIEIENLLSNEKKMKHYQCLSWKNFKHTSKLSSIRLDKFRKQILDDFF